jgi:virulence-associated protein VagC
MSSHLSSQKVETLISIEDEIRISIEANKPEGRWEKFFRTGPVPSDDFLQIRSEQLQEERESLD